MALLKVKFVLGNGATDGFMKIDRRFVTITNGKGEHEVTDTVDHRVAMTFEGPAGSTLEYEIAEGTATLVKGKVTISFGQVEGLVAGPFKLKSKVRDG